MVYEEEEATRKYLAWQEAVNKEVPIRVLEEVEPPDMNVKEFPLHVVPGVGNPSLFWIHYGQRSAEMLDTMQSVLNSCLSDLQRVKSIAELESLSTSRKTDWTKSLFTPDLVFSNC